VGRDKTHVEEFSDEELDAIVEGARSLRVEAELKMRLVRYELGMVMEEKEWRKSGKPRKSAEDWEKYWNDEVEEAARICNVDLGYVAEIALKLSREK
jgi:sugar phosphate isomerase/epimerase